VYFVLLFSAPEINKRCASPVFLPDCQSQLTAPAFFGSEAAPGRMRIGFFRAFGISIRGKRTSDLPTCRILRIFAES